MASILPLRLVRLVDGNLEVFDPRILDSRRVDFDIISYTWGDMVKPYNCGIKGVEWDVPIRRERLEDIKKLMISAGEEYSTQFLWVDCICINQSEDPDNEKPAELAKMYQYYKSARRCHILIHMPKVWDPQDIVDKLQFIDHVRTHMGGAALASEARLTENMTKRLITWENNKWTFRIDKDTVRSSAINMGMLNCYSTCIGYVKSLFRNLYFSRVWTFQEMLLGKNITMWGINNEGSSDKRCSHIGELDIWMDLATDSMDKAVKLRDWIEDSRRLNTVAVNTILRVIIEDCLSLYGLQRQVEGIISARTDIISGGPNWWHDNYKGISNVFSAVSMRPRDCWQKGDIFRGLLGVFNGLFTPEEIKREMMGEDIERISFAFFKQLSIKTRYAWTRLVISSGDRGQWDWIPVVANYSRLLTTDCLAGVINLGVLGQNGQANVTALTGIRGAPRKYMSISLKHQENRGFQFVFKGCNCGKTIKTGLFSSEPILINNQPTDVVTDETGRTLVQCATILGNIIDPGCNIVAYRERLLKNLQPDWNISDQNAKPANWTMRCVSGSLWENPGLVRTHNMSMHLKMVDIFSCGSRLENESTANISCEVRVNCGCTLIAPFSWIFEAITAVEGSSLGETAAYIDENTDRITLHDGLGLVQVGDVGKAFNLVAFGGDINSHKSYAHSCRSIRTENYAVPKLPFPKGRALVREEFSHGLLSGMRGYGYVETRGCGNLLIYKKHPLGKYKIIGVCIDGAIENKKGRRSVAIR